MLESLSNEVAAWNFIKERFQKKCLLVNIAKFLRTAFFFTEHPSGCFCKDFFQGILRNSQNYYLLVRQ